MQPRNRSLLSVTSLMLASIFTLAIAFVAPWQTHAASQSQPARASIPREYFAPYTDITMEHDFARMARDTGTKYFSLGFVIANTNNTCDATWAGTTSVSHGFMQSDIKALRAMGGDVIPSFGGAAGTELAIACSSVASLQAQYQRVIDAYHLTHVDFDIEGDAINNAPSIDRRNQAIAALQARAQAKGRRLVVSYTLSVNTYGMDPTSVALLQNAVSHGVNVSVVNIMVMDYYDPQTAPPNQMGENAIKAAKSTVNQLRGVYPAKTTRQLWSMIGLTPMVGENDNTVEVFTKQDARQVLAFARQHGIAELSFWAVELDQPCTGNRTPTNTCSGISQKPFDYDHIFDAYNK
ncbi:MAG: hypothetical protein H0W02_13765 [Ktedonobacteraceae bacterium]|nr:hypothetical protein [Ktedonobacteraceae bacterium]